MAAPRLIERRRHLRAYIPIAVSMRSQRDLPPDDGLLQNLSEGGALVSCRQRYPDGEPLQLIMHMPGGGDIRLSAIVARSGTASDNTLLAAVEFAPALQQATRLIDEYIRSEAANRHSRAVLVADDSPFRLRQVSEQLITRGYRPLLASTTLQATTWLDAESDALVLALVGSSLRSGSTDAFLEWLADAYPALHRARFVDALNGTKLQMTLDRVAREKPPVVPWSID